MKTKLEALFAEKFSEKKDIEISYPTELYVVKLLCDFSDKPNLIRNEVCLVDLVNDAVKYDGYLRREKFKQIGDFALIVSGLYPDRVMRIRRQTSLDYYINVGRASYSNLDLEVFQELSEKFPYIVEILNDVGLDIKTISGSLYQYVKRRQEIERTFH